MLYLIHGQDTFRSLEFFKGLIEKTKKSSPQGLDFQEVDLTKQNFLDFESLFQTDSLFDEVKLFVLRELFQAPSKELEKFQEFFSKASFESPKKTLVVFEKKDLKKAGLSVQQKKLLKILCQKAQLKKFDLLKPQELQLWIKGQFQKARMEAEPGVVNFLAEAIGPDLWRLKTEIDRLTALKGGNVLALEEVESLVRGEIEPDIFEMIDALGQKNKKRALQTLDQQLQKGKPPSYLVSMFAYQFRNMLLVKELLTQGLGFSEIQRTSGLHPYPLKKAIAQARFFSFSQLREIFQKIVDLDTKLKYSKVPSQIWLERFIFQL